MKTGLYLIAALVAVNIISACDSERELPMSSSYEYYHFDGSKPLEQITFVPGRTSNTGHVYTPHLSSRDYLTLALRLLPPDFVTDKAVFDEAYFSSDDCDTVATFDNADFSWSVPISGTDPGRRIYSVVLEASTGSVVTSSHVMLGRRDLPPDLNTTINPGLAESVLRVVVDALTSTKDGDAPFNIPDGCSVMMQVFQHSPLIWRVYFDFPSSKKHVMYSVDTLSMQVNPKKDDNATTDALSLIVSLALAILITILCVGIWLLLRRRMRRQ